MSESRAPDAGRRKKALDTSRSFIVQAPAGSGKTTLLTQRFLALLAISDAVENVLAITFTRKAAAEMRHRVISALETAASGKEADDALGRQTNELASRVLERDARNGWELISNPSALRIQTIDAFAAGLARRLPVLSRFGAPMAVVEDAAPLYRDAAARVLEELERNADVSRPLEILLDQLDNNYERAEQLIADMLAIREHWLGHVIQQRGPEARDALERGLNEVVSAALSRIDSVLPGSLRDEIVAMAAHGAENLRIDKPDSPLTICHELTEWPQPDSDNLPLYRALRHLLLTGSNSLRKIPLGGAFKKGPDDRALAGADFRSRMKDVLASIDRDPEIFAAFEALSHIPAPAYTDEQWRVLEALFEVLLAAPRELLLVFEREGRVDFTQILLGATEALGEEDAPTDLALLLDYRVRHLLVDEFQDTSFQQFRLFERLVSGWSPGDGRTAFLVGDPMQSIYRFRNAEVALFGQAARDGLGPVRLEPVELTANFRSDEALIDWYNENFPEILADDDDEMRGAVSYVAAQATRESARGSGVVIHARTVNDAEEEARQVAEIVYGESRMHPDRNIAVLVRGRSHLNEILPQLTAKKLAYRAVDLEHLGERQIIKDLKSLTLALTDPADRIAWLATLRAPWCGLTLSDLAALFEGAGDVPAWTLLGDSERCDGLSEDGALRIARFVETFRNALRERDKTSLAARVEGLWIALGGPAVAGQPAGLEDAQTYFEELSTLVRAGGLPDRELLDRRLGRLFGAPGTDEPRAIQVMTLHHAKGLEFDTVVIPGLHRPVRGSGQRLLHWDYVHGQHGHSLLLAPVNAPGERDDIQAFLKKRDADRDRHELARLAYVGTTRARHGLHLVGFAGWSSKTNTIKPPRQGTLLESLWPGIRKKFTEKIERHHADNNQTIAMTHIAQKLETTPANHDELRRLPVDWKLPVLPETAGITGMPPTRGTPDIEFEWAGHTARHVGTVVHRALQEIARVRPAEWNATWRTQAQSHFRNQLALLGVAREVLDAATEKALRAVQQTLEDPRGLWLLDRDPSQAVAEFQVSGQVEGRVINAIIDRSFVDDEIRWIVDYKTGEHEGGDVDAFLDNEVERYRPQLERYAQLVSEQSSRTIRTGIYFPLITGWREWDPFERSS